ncbi:hypothetical protein AcW1_009657 [Taiwanofungus camphoratus]|nr:hypothetical protein AcV7_002553 [Antrodia cinnamomea]KAI0948051.1 hypothetical protein AcW1_009657 [Antrodia cinnamomea]
MLMHNWLRVYYGRCMTVAIMRRSPKVVNAIPLYSERFPSGCRPSMMNILMKATQLNFCHDISGSDSERDLCEIDAGGLMVC